MLCAVIAINSPVSPQSNSTKGVAIIPEAGIQDVVTKHPILTMVTEEPIEEEEASNITAASPEYTPRKSQQVGQWTETLVSSLSSNINLLGDLLAKSCSAIRLLRFSNRFTPESVPKLTSIPTLVKSARGDTRKNYVISRGIGYIP
jgi:hypothetical protein